MAAIDFPSSPTDGQVFGNYVYDSAVGVWRASVNAVPGLPAGTILQWPSNTAPANWVFCDGSALSRTAYASLFAAIGTSYGAGDGSTTFNVPDFRGKFPVGKSTDTEFNTLGETGGSKTIQGYGSGTATGYGLTYSSSMSSTTDGTTAQNLPPYNVVNFIIKTSAGATSSDSELAIRVGNLESVNNATPLGPNYIINGAMDIWQRGTSFSSAGYTADRWLIQANGSGATRTISRQSFTPGNEISGNEAQYYLRYSQSVAGSGATFNLIDHRIEDVRTLAGQTITVSFWAKAAAAATYTSQVQQVFGVGGSAEVQAVSTQSISVTTSWQRFSYTFTMPSISGKTIGPDSYVVFRINLPNNATFTLDLWGVQVEAGQYATPFRRNANSIQAELAACQRYYEILVPPSSVTGAGFVNSATSAYIHLPFRTTKRASATVSYVGTIGGITALWSGGGNAATNFTSPGGTDSAYGVVTTSGLSTGQAIMFNTSSAVRIIAESEL